MNINEKQKLWSKYYLLYTNNNINSLYHFVNNEVKLFNINDYKNCKRKKIFRFMLKTLDKQTIIKNYYPYNLKYKVISKNEMINNLIKITYHNR